VTVVSLTVRSERREGLSVVKLGGAVEDDVLTAALEALRAISDDGPLIIDIDDLTICSPAPFEALLNGVRENEHAQRIVLVCRRRSARRLLGSLDAAQDLPVYDRVESVLLAPQAESARPG
jgi:hypothetical protein